MGAVQWTTLSEVEPAPVLWLWESRVPCGKVTLVDGEPGSGKSLLALDLAARVSRGASMPLTRAKSMGPSNVLLFNDDDSLPDTIRPRLEAAGADLGKIHTFDGEIDAAAVGDRKPALIIIDPLSVYLCQSCPDRQSTPRLGLKRLNQLARETNAAVLAVQYLPKEGFWAGEVFDAARSVLFISSIGHGRHRVAVTKSNLRAPNEIPPFVYNIERAGESVKLTGWADSV
jgi:putative DNA primase/helicase